MESCTTLIGLTAAKGRLKGEEGEEEEEEAAEDQERRKELCAAIR